MHSLNLRDIVLDLLQCKSIQWSLAADSSAVFKTTQVVKMGKILKTPKMKYRIERQSTSFKGGKSLYYRFQGWRQGRAREL